MLSSASTSLLSSPWALRTLSRRSCTRCRRNNSSSTAEFLPLPRGIAPRRGLLLLSVPVPPQDWPSHLEIASPLFSRLSKTLKPTGIAVNARYDPSLPSTSTFADREVYSAKLHLPDGSHVFWASLSADNVGKDLVSQIEKATASVEPTKAAVVEGTGENHEILVCTHGSRDCRCSDRGSPLVIALREEVERRGMGHRVSVGEVAHVGGHKYAANAILLPSLDMLSNLTAEHAPALLTHILEGRKRDSGMWAHWRGRYGLSEADQAALWAKVDPARLSGYTAETAATEAKAEKVKLRFRTFEGDLREVSAGMGESLLAIGKANGLPALEGVCGGNLECATCHLYLPSTAPVPPPSEEELDMLGYALSYRPEESRLGCQIKVTPELAKWAEQGGVVGLPRY